ncbi:alpha-1,4-glucan--maltose-1-phosphate maltosyltransferase [Actinomyces capricornis]|uniref:Alpha-1,4-glucan:maltose-1-phosphate maltosyltransferase n=1 Tax=Actinomyces capricornis TaxID=2755559 RepID=A0ABN6K1N4_9ACTO|nr:alpha-1,4-glucan:maltose-1-phosphate maltosyltransferase [Actinomyces capricornis]
MTPNTTRQAATTPSPDQHETQTPAPPAFPVGAVPQPTPFAPVGRIPVTEVFPVIEDGRWPAKAVVGEVIPVRATVFREGHDRFGATAVLIRPDGTDGPSAPMREIAVGRDLYEAQLVPDAPGDWSFRVEGWSDPYATWSHDAGIKVPAGVDVELMLEEGARVLERAAQVQGRDEEGASVLRGAASGLREASRSPEERLAAGRSPEVVAALERLPLRDYVSPSAAYPLQVDRPRALAGSWYEIFPRSLGSGADEHGNWHSGTLRSAAERLERIAAMGFDVLYLTPISPIGLTNRKGRNNTLTARPGDPGSPYGIGSADGGHDAIHPDLGTFEDFDALVARAGELGMEVALDLALQCSPDHPWVAEHPEWFTVLSDGSIAYAENPPKKYQDIYPLNFDNDPEGIYAAILEVVRTWIRHGVTIFRVDNPHTKPLPFWQRLIAQIHAESPEVLFLAEAFTRPAMMRTLGKIGFHQSYTYFAWRNTKAELIEYIEELSRDTAHVLRPAFWPTTHDILTPFMTNGKVPAFKLRAVLAATLSPTWGIYSGYELAESTPRPGYEEQIDNEKYEYKPRDFGAARANGIEDLLTRLNSARAAHPALTQLRNITFHATSDDSLIAYSKRLEAAHSPTGRQDVVLTVVNLDPHSARAGEVYLDLEALGLPAGTDGSHPVVRVTDELTGASYDWSGQNYVRLDPFAGQVAHIFSVEAL